MPPITQLDEVFLSRLLNNDDNVKQDILNTNVDSKTLSTVLNKLTTTSNAYRQELFEKVHANFDEFSGLYNTSQDLHFRVFELVKQAGTTEKQITDNQAAVTLTIDTYQQALLDTQNNKVQIDTLEKLEQILLVIDEIHVELKESLYLEAVKHILELIRILKEWKADTRVMGYIEGRVAQLKQTLILRLQEDIRTAIQYNLGSMRILEFFGSKPVHIKDIFESLNQLELLAQEMTGIKRLIFKNIITPYFENGTSQLQVDHVGGDSSGGVLQVIKVTNDNEKMDPILMLQQMDEILGYFFKYMFNSSKDENLNRLFGNLLLPELTDLIIEKGIAPAIPSSKYNLSDFNLVAQAVLAFEDKCIEYGYQIPEAGPTKLALYVQNIDKHYAKKRREKILQQGRTVMVRRLYDAEMTQVKEDNGHTYQYKITQTPRILSVLISDTIDEAQDLLQSHPISASTLVEGIQDLLDMYRAIMPSYHRQYYLSGPAKSLLFRNDCLWLSKQLRSTVSLKPECKHFNKLTNDLNAASERLEELGKAWYELAMMHRVQVIQTLLDQLDGFTGMSGNAKYQKECDLAITQVIDLVGSFASETRPIVDETLLLDMLGRIVDSILGRLIQDIEELQDIGAEESHVIAVTLNSLAQLVAAFDLPGKDATESFVSELVPSWEKFWHVKDILEMNMRDIMEEFRRGDLHMFEKSELVGLLSALFAETELRESNIQEIKTGTQRVDGSVATRPIAGPASSPTPPSTFSPTPTATFTPTATSTSTATSTPTGSIHRALEYTPDDDMETSDGGWGDDDEDDLFADEQPEPTIVVPSPKSSEPSLLLDANIDIEDTGGWGDADEDIFDNDEIEEPKSLETHKSTITADAKIEPSDKISATNSSETPLSRALDFQSIDNEIDNELNEGEGWGWDDDDDLFKGGEDLK
ncbi:Centromere/kinetochore Zw10-domain-containing protein [Mucor mucedo]|uniref:Centromere/kinetochore Zw10-domain-containing protein n=1 Tax=Mucor mucedo TaxID=29922 RepID=UPI00221F03EF|nr:Centromere/kinetochore Zw10-domain-containing protein [Mucor mucedo]KAI7893841.1 Centromere/kinetochore Zw10-domain-containing protein [Mucor mucedo]